MYTGAWDNSTGWMNYGPYDFDPKAAMAASEKPSHYVNSSGKHAFLSQLPQPALTNVRDQSWSFYCGWSDQGAIFYYHFLLKKSGAIVNPVEQAREMIHFVSVLSLPLF